MSQNHHYDHRLVIYDVQYVIYDMYLNETAKLPKNHEKDLFLLQSLRLLILPFSMLLALLQDQNAKDKSEGRFQGQHQSPRGS